MQSSPRRSPWLDVGSTTGAYVERRTAQGLSKPEIIRCLKRYVAREIYAILHDTITPAST